MRIFKILILILGLLFISCAKKETKSMNNEEAGKKYTGKAKAVLAAGCFWCVEAPFKSLDGVVEVISGYSGGDVENPTYEQVCSGKTGHAEAIQVVYDPSVISFSEILDIYWKQFDPTDAGGSFHDRGSQYASIIFYQTDEEKAIAEKSKESLERSGIFKQKIATQITKLKNFYLAEEYHQNYAEKNPVRYKSYKKGSGREDFILGLWGDINLEKYKKASKEELKTKLTPVEYNVSQACGTEPPFKNEYYDNKRIGIYVDKVSGEPLFSSTDKYDSGSGWPSFTKPIDPRYLVKLKDTSLYMQRVEVRSKFGDSHLGHVFDDGPSPTKLRYCMNSASLKFIPYEEMEKEGYGEYKRLFN